MTIKIMKKDRRRQERRQRTGEPNWAIFDELFDLTTPSHSSPFASIIFFEAGVRG
jgi:hypothetical protein